MYKNESRHEVIIEGNDGHKVEFGLVTDAIILSYRNFAKKEQHTSSISLEAINEDDMQEALDMAGKIHVTILHDSNVKLENGLKLRELSDIIKGIAKRNNNAVLVTLKNKTFEKQFRAMINFMYNYQEGEWIAIESI